MAKKIILSLLQLLLLASCVKASLKPGMNTPVAFMTATLPPTKTGLALLTLVGSTTTPVLINPSAATADPACNDSALLVADVTYPDLSRLNAREKFTKTWRLQNAGDCKWVGYTAAFISGDKMDAPDSVAVAQTNSKASVDVSVDLIAPATDGTFTGIFELRNAAGTVVPIGRERSFWVKILVGTGASTTSSSGAAAPPQPVSSSQCQYSPNAGYVQQLIDLINQARAAAQLPTLTVNAQLMAAAQSHSVDMACGNYLSHSGPNGEHIGYRLREIGFAGPGFSEIIAIGTPQDAMSQWQNDPGHWEIVMNLAIQQIGVGYAYFASSDYGSYITVDFS